MKVLRRIVGWVDDSQPNLQFIITRMQYRRDSTKGATYFFTVVTHSRAGLFDAPEAIANLRAAFHSEIVRRPFRIDAVVILPDHIHAIWTLPSGDDDFSMRWRNIKRSFTATVAEAQRPDVYGSRKRKKEQGIWQRRFWEHRIRDDLDFARHVDYIHYNPVKHGYANRPIDWPHSSIHRYIREGVLPADWGASSIDIPDGIGYE